jgi:hypothetical protein
MAVVKVCRSHTQGEGAEVCQMDVAGNRYLGAKHETGESFVHCTAWPT